MEEVKESILNSGEGNPTLPSPSSHVILILKHIFLITGRFTAVYDSNYHFRKSMLFQKIMRKQEIFVLLRRRTNE